MRRLFWVSVGVVLTVAVVLKGKQIYERFTPKGIARQINTAQRSLTARTTEFIHAVTEAAEKREAELHELLD